ncbi:MAG: T9SS type A sorting domain-containing protein, partial [Chitinophagaceae bacterium]
FAVTGVIATFKVFPNPFGDQITFNVVRPVSRPSAVFLKLVDARGAVLRNEKYTLESGNTQITLRNLQSISPGIYYTIIVTEDGTILGKEKIVKN